MTPGKRDHETSSPDEPSTTQAVPRSHPYFSRLSTLNRGDALLSFGAILISGLSLWVAFETEQTNRQLVAEAVWPYLQVYHSAHGSSGEPELSLNIKNAGVGPAKIESLEVFWNGKPVGTYQELLTKCCGYHAGTRPPPTSRDSPNPLSTSIASGTVLRAGESVALIRYRRSGADASVYKDLDGARDKIQYRICYCSIFDQCWAGNGEVLNPPHVSECATPSIPYSE